MFSALILCFVLKSLYNEIILLFRLNSSSKLPGVGKIYNAMGSWEDLITRGSKEDMNKELCTIFKENSDKDMIVSNLCGQKFCSF